LSRSLYCLPVVLAVCVLCLAGCGSNGRNPPSIVEADDLAGSVDAAFRKVATSLGEGYETKGGACKRSGDSDQIDSSSVPAERWQCDVSVLRFGRQISSGKLTIVVDSAGCWTTSRSYYRGLSQRFSPVRGCVRGELSSR
jgi:hypothetical protein